MTSTVVFCKSAIDMVDNAIERLDVKALLPVANYTDISANSLYIQNPKMFGKITDTPLKG